jgi:hypothetical protein
MTKVKSSFVIQLINLILEYFFRMFITLFQ